MWLWLLGWKILFSISKIYSSYRWFLAFLSVVVSLLYVASTLWSSFNVSLQMNYLSKKNWWCLNGLVSVFADINWKILKKPRLPKSFCRKRGLWLVGQSQISAFHQVTVLIISSVAGIMLKNLEKVTFFLILSL